MGKRWGSADFKQLKEFQKKLERFEKTEADAFCRSCAKELAARLLAKVIKRTPVGDHVYYNEVITDAEGNAVKYKRGKNKGKTKTKRKVKRVGGTLRRGWTVKTEEEAKSGGSDPNVGTYVDSMEISKTGDAYQITIENPVSYASYVEYGHRTRNHKGWVTGRFMLTASEIELAREAPKLLEDMLTRKLAEVFNGK